MYSGEIIKKYSNRQQVPAGPGVTTYKENYKYYSRNDFKRYMGYEEPDYLMVAGLYASTESSKKSQPYNHFLVKKADYVAKILNWYDEEGHLDVKRAENAIRSACRKKAPNGLFYMYTLSNKDKYLTDKGGSRIYMSGMRYSQLQEEFAKNAVSYAQISDRADQDTDPESPEGEDDLTRVRKMVRRLADIYDFCGYEEGAVVWVAKHLLDRLSVDEIRQYFNQVISEDYFRQIKYNLGCPRFSCIFDIFHKYDKIQRFMSNGRRHRY